MGGEEITKAGYKFLYPTDKEKGGFRATVFILTLTSLHNMGFVANMASMALYFRLVMHFDVSGSVNTLTNFMGSTLLFSLFGGFISDTYLSRLHTSLIFGALELLALIMVTIQAHFDKLHPKPCGESSCVEGGMAVTLYASLCLLALGSGGVRGALVTLGADQFNQKDPDEVKALPSLFNCLLLGSVLGATVGVTVIMWVSMNLDWYWGFFVSLVAVFIGFVVLVLGKPFYRLQAPEDSSNIMIAQVIVVAIKNQSLLLPGNPDDLFEINNKETVSTEEKISHTNQFRFLDKAAILREDSKPEPWTVCTVTQVEQVKILASMLPIIGSTIITNICLAQLQTLSIHQGYDVNLYHGSSEVWPAPSIPVMPLVFMSILIPIYEFVLVPLAQKITHHLSGIMQLHQVVVELVLLAISIALAGFVELLKRWNQANKVPNKTMSLFWLSFQFGIFEMANIFTLVGLLKFLYKEKAPASMRSISTSIMWISLSLGYFLSSIFVNIVNSIAKRITLTRSRQEGFHREDLNKNDLNLFYWFLAILGCLNFANYLYWNSWYKYKSEESDSEPRPKA